MKSFRQNRNKTRKNERSDDAIEFDEQAEGTVRVPKFPAVLASPKSRQTRKKFFRPFRFVLCQKGGAARG